MTLNIYNIYIHRYILYTVNIHKHRFYKYTHNSRDTENAPFTTVKLHIIINYKGSTILQQSHILYRNNCMAKPEVIFVKGTLGKEYKGGTYYRNRRFYYRPIGLHLDTEKKIVILLEK